MLIWTIAYHIFWWEPTMVQHFGKIFNGMVKDLKNVQNKRKGE